MALSQEYNITPVPKPRMTSGDKWKKRPNVMRYWAFKDECRLKKVSLAAHGCHVTFIMPMPKSWPKRKKEEMNGAPHVTVPDLDNLFKALGDALYDDDSAIWDCRVSKCWGYSGKIIINSCE